MWKRLAAHPITPLGLGALLSFVIPGLVIAKFWVLLAFCVWLNIDVWIWLHGLSGLGNFRNAVLCTITTLTVVVMLLADRMILKQLLDELQKDTYQNLEGTVNLPFSGDPFHSLFTVTNHGASRVGSHTLICSINVVATSTIVLANLNSSVKSSDAPLDRGGDAQSDPCLALFGGGRPRCFDVTLLFNYVLEVQPGLNNTKSFRFVGLENANTFAWTKEPIEQRQSYYASFMRR